MKTNSGIVKMICVAAVVCAPLWSWAGIPGPADTASTVSDIPVTAAAEETPSARPPFVALKGRISLQYYGMFYDQTAFDVSQPGAILNLSGKFGNGPMSFDMYGAFRRMSIGGGSPFASSARDLTRIYRLSLAYDDSVYAVTVGRIIPMIAPTIGYTDGLLVSRRFGVFTIGTNIGYQPNYSQQGLNTDYRKVTVFANYQSRNLNAGSFTTAYTRTYHFAILDREVVSLGGNMFTTGGFSFFANADVDLRKKSGSQYELSPALSTLFGTASYRFSSLLTLGAGVMSVRPFTTWTMLKDIPDNFLDTRLRTDLILNANLYFPVGISVYSSYTPRVSDEPFGKQYSTFNTITAANVLRSGVLVRGTFGLNGSEFATVHYYGAGLQRSLFGFLDVSLRYDRQQQNLAVSSLQYINNSYSTDLLVMIKRSLFISLTHTYMNSAQLKYNSVYSEISWRF